ncbi:type VII secretion protein EccCa [Nocardioides sp. Y6]|uniref:Type VII secretion protein EccCa n=1 Tax=Nocardioides malaquae TaxID=2773426 RepID=A0ABR9RRM2_9ACTN|nr:type VII secretion protein EccCa [Nocardioides malaquae]MBE7324050.1 type VII secretion protein EccCa [Nocardioides malaquae]
MSLASPAPLAPDAGTAAGDPQRTITLPAPPELPAADQGSAVLTSTLPMLAGLGSMVMMAGMSGVGQGRTLVAGGFFLLSTAMVVGTQVARQRRQHRRRVDETRAAFLRELAAVRDQVETAATEHRARLQKTRPTLETWLAAGARGDGPDDHRVRVGVATLPTGHSLVCPAPADPERADPFALRAVRALASRGALADDTPLVLDLTAWDELVVTTAATTETSAEAARGLARLLVTQVAVSHSPATARVVLACEPARLRHWEWLKWLPHHRSLTERDVGAGRRLLVSDAPWPPDLDDTRSTLLVLDGSVAVPRALLARAGTTVVRLWEGEQAASPNPRRAVLELGTGVPSLRTVAGALPCTFDTCSPTLAEVVARRLEGRADVATCPTGVALDDLPAMAGIGDLDAWQAETWWSTREPTDALRVPIGTDESGEVLHLDLKESAQGGDGPHGLVVGATGSGKSELLRTLVVSLALQHPPEELGMVLVDFKGGATFAGLGELPHVAAVVTNLGDDLALVDRMADTLTGELVRRQELLRRSGHASLNEHRNARRAGADLEPLPSLFVCIDEFSELLTARPEFIDVFVAIGRVGRSLGVHLLLASQRLEEGRLRGLETHLSYRIGLRTFSAAESRAAIGQPDAHLLPPVPGAGYLATSGQPLVRFTAAYVSGPPPHHARDTAVAPRPLPWTLLPLPDRPSPRPAQARHEEVAGETSTADLVVARSRHASRTRSVWLPPLERPATVGALLADVTHTPDLGLHSPSWRARSGRLLPLGLVDLPREARRELFTVDLSGATGHCAVVGGPHSGRTTTLQTLVAALALTATPVEAQLLLLDHGGGGLAPLAVLPHVVASATRGEPLFGHVVEEVVSLVDRREALFREHGIDSFEAYATRRRTGAVDDGYGEVYLVVDGWGGLRSSDHETEAVLHQLAERALPLGVHLVVATQRWSDLRPSLRDQFGSSVELRLGDPLESTHDRRRAAAVPRRAGHGLAPGGHALLTALPALAPTSDSAPPPDSVADLVAAVDRGWHGPRPAPLAHLPEQVDLAQLRRDTGTPPELLLGHDGRGCVALDSPSHLVVRGAPGSGRTTVLRSHLQELQRLHPAAALQVVLVDPRGGLHGEVAEDQLLHHLVSRSQMQARLEELASYLRGRLPGPEVTADELRSRTWWQGAEVVVVVDDHDVAVAGGWQECGLHQLAPLLPRADEVGLHVVVAQRSATGFGGRASDPLMQALVDLEVPVLELGEGASAGAPGSGGGRSAQRRTGAPVGRGVLTRRGLPPVRLQVARAEAPSVARRRSAAT